MATTKKPEAEKKVTATAAKPAAKAATTKAAAKTTATKTTATKTAAKATTATAAKKTTAKKPAVKKPAAKKATEKVEVFVEFGGIQVSIDEVVKNVKATYGKTAKNVTVYLKPEESKAYFVADGENGEMDVYFC